MEYRGCLMRLWSRRSAPMPQAPQLAASRNERDRGKQINYPRTSPPTRPPRFPWCPSLWSLALGSTADQVLLESDLCRHTCVRRSFVNSTVVVHHSCPVRCQRVISSKTYWEALRIESSKRRVCSIVDEHVSDLSAKSIHAYRCCTY